MKNQLARTALAAAFGLLTAAVPGYCTVMYPGLSFSASPSAGSILVNDSGATPVLTSFSGVTLTAMAVTNDATAALDTTFTLNGVLLSYASNTLTLTLGQGGSITGTGSPFANLNTTAAAIVLGSWSIPGGITYTSSGTPGGDQFTVLGPNVNIEFGAATNLSESAAFVSDLNATGDTLTGLGGGVTGNGGTVNGTNETFTAHSNTFTATLTPEPASILMLTGGLLAMALFGRKRIARS